MSYGVGRRHGLDPALLWLWCRPAAIALIGPLVWEPPYAAGVALKKKNQKCIKDISTIYTQISMGQYLSALRATMIFISTIGMRRLPPFQP